MESVSREKRFSTIVDVAFCVSRLSVKILWHLGNRLPSFARLGEGPCRTPLERRQRAGAGGAGEGPHPALTPAAAQACWSGRCCERVPRRHLRQRLRGRAAGVDARPGSPPAALASERMGALEGEVLKVRRERSCRRQRGVSRRDEEESVGTELAPLAGRPSAGDRDVLDGEVHAGGSPASTLASSRACCGERGAGEGLPAGVLPATAWAGRKGVGGGSPAATHAGGHAGVPEGEAQGRVPRRHTRQRARGCAGWGGA